MNILICYHSKTGNTEKIAESIAKGLESFEVSVRPAKDVDPNELKNYDVVFLGSGIYAGGIGKSAVNLIKNTTSFPKNFVLFSTHANNDPRYYGKAFKKVEKIIKRAGSQIIGAFDCIGENKNPKVVKLLLQSSPELEPAIELSKGHPNDEDFENAKNFAKSVIEKLQNK
ncbi:MAG: flavodoxin family protein [Candidatus Helarchaeota archaeon]